MLRLCELEIEENKNSILGYYYKAAALGCIGESVDDSSERAKYYEEMNETFDMAESIADMSETVPREIDFIDDIKVAFWQTEFKRGYDLATDDSLQQTVEKPNEKSIQHLRNATQIKPEKSSSWNVLAQIAARSEEYKEAVDAKEKYVGMISEAEIDIVDYLHLGYYYFNLEEQEKVVEVLEKGQECYPENQNIVSALVDAYSRVGKTDEAIATLEQLVEQEPENARYRLVMGTKIYQQAMRIRDTLDTNSQQILDLQKKIQQPDPSEEEKIKNKIQEISSENEELMARMNMLTGRAEEEVKAALEYQPNDAAAYETLGVIYQNKAKTYFDQRNRTSDNSEAEKYDQTGKDTIRQAMEYFEKAVEIEPENKSYWKSLFQIYTFLGMEKKARKAQQNMSSDQPN